MAKTKNIKAGKAAQLKIQQMAFMIMAVFIFFILAGIFFVSVSVQGMKRDVTRLEREKAIATVANLVDTAEFTCGKSLCLDADKLIVLSSGMKDVFEGLWPVAGIKVRKLHPLISMQNIEDVECTRLTYPECNVFDVYKNDEVKTAGAVSSFVALCRKENKEGFVYDKCELGQINIAYRAVE
ncbi:hypothetical protein HYT26_04440 [Candidatus Pacearchaeota archaeon]|nr:hypothetical protein [Candidatus Pacearchaeota archaeon]